MDSSDIIIAHIYIAASFVTTNIIAKICCWIFSFMFIMLSLHKLKSERNFIDNEFKNIQAELIKFKGKRK